MTKIVTPEQLQEATASAVCNIDKITKRHKNKYFQKLEQRRRALVWLFNQLAGMDKNTPKQN